MSSLISSPSHRPGLHCRRVPLENRRRNRRSFDQSHTRAPFPDWCSLRNIEEWNFIFYPMLWSSPTSLTARTPLSPRGPGWTGTSLDWFQNLIIMNIWNCGWGRSWGDDQADWVIRLAHLRPKIMIRAVRQKRAGAMHSHRWCTDNNVLHGGLHRLKVDTAPWRGLKFSLHSCVDGIVYSCSQYDEETMMAEYY